jgi:CheY-like chemotaxis protein
MPEQKHIILYAEDDPDDLYIVQQAFERYDDNIHVMHCPDGRETIECLEELKQMNLFPCLIILDMNMPGMNGRDTLMHLRKLPDYQDIPVVMFTTSSSPADSEFARQWSADFITKPAKYNDLEALAKRFVERCELKAAS